MERGEGFGRRLARSTGPGSDNCWVVLTGGWIFGSDPRAGISCSDGNFSDSAGFERPKREIAGLFIDDFVRS